MRRLTITTFLSAITLLAATPPTASAKTNDTHMATITLGSACVPAIAAPAAIDPASILEIAAVGDSADIVIMTMNIAKYDPGKPGSDIVVNANTYTIDSGATLDDKANFTQTYPVGGRLGSTPAMPTNSLTKVQETKNLARARHNRVTPARYHASRTADTGAATHRRHRT